MSNMVIPGAQKPDDLERILALQAQIADLKQRLPRHSVPASMLQELEELEEELERLIKSAESRD